MRRHKRRDGCGHRRQDDGRTSGSLQPWRRCDPGAGEALRHGNWSRDKRHLILRRGCGQRKTKESLEVRGGLVIQAQRLVKAEAHTLGHNGISVLLFEQFHIPWQCWNREIPGHGAGPRLRLGGRRCRCQVDEGVHHRDQGRLPQRLQQPIRSFLHHDSGCRDDNIATAVGLERTNVLKTLVLEQAGDPAMPERGVAQLELKARVA
mmetsp:Transcript_150993/g.485238  ORF Transcript_150993/g.485238 Transcript_150993/m.485238 type:complete len:206 (-) Transcript_150993:743-1360(-)